MHPNNLVNELTDLINDCNPFDVRNEVHRSSQAVYEDNNGSLAIWI